MYKCFQHLAVMLSTETDVRKTYATFRYNNDPRYALKVMGDQ